MAQPTSARAPRGLIGLEGAMQTPEEVLVMRQLLERQGSLEVKQNSVPELVLASPAVPKVL